MTPFKIDNRIINDGEPPYLIAEISGNHNGELSRALELIHMAKEAGADAVKIQTYTADTMTLPIKTGDFIINGGIWDGKSLYELYEWAHTPWDWHLKLFEYAKELNITLFSSPFDETAVDLLESLKTPAYKIASFEFLDHPLIEYIIPKAKPFILSTGMATSEEIIETTTILEKHNASYALLHCISGYPTPTEQANVRAIATLKSQFQCPIGLSDHTLSDIAAITAIGQGANIIEKHFTDSRKNKGPDSDFSLEFDELKSLKENIHQAWLSLGNGAIGRQKAEESNVQFRRSIYFCKDLPSGHIITKEDIKRIRPGKGLAPKHFNELIGKKTNKVISLGDPVTFNSIQV